MEENKQKTYSPLKAIIRGAVTVGVALAVSIPGFNYLSVRNNNEHYAENTAAYVQRAQADVQKMEKSREVYAANAQIDVQKAQSISELVSSNPEYKEYLNITAQNERERIAAVTQGEKEKIEAAAKGRAIEIQTINNSRTLSSPSRLVEKVIKRDTIEAIANSNTPAKQQLIYEIICR